MSTWEEAVAMATLSEGIRDTAGRQGEQEKLEQVCKNRRKRQEKKVRTQVNQIKKNQLAATDRMSAGEFKYQPCWGQLQSLLLSEGEAICQYRSQKMGTFWTGPS